MKKLLLLMLVAFAMPLMAVNVTFKVDMTGKTITSGVYI